jgi:tRNA threonylcarbamoyl adenosine modification protein YjeE
MVRNSALLLDDEAATGRLAQALARALEPGDVVALSGPLGSGKTFLVRAIVRALGRPDEDVPSPTFTLVQAYDLPDFTLWHFDLYRIESPDEAAELGFEEALAGGVTMIEWPERLGAALPPDCLRIELDFGAERGARRAVLSGPESWASRLGDLGA